MLRASGRHPWRPAHIHMVMRAEGYATLVTHIFDQDSEYLDSDAVFAVKSSLHRRFEERSGKDPARPPGVDRPWCSLRSDILLARGASTRIEHHGRTA
jgi:catechol 1,2-dioxygenase